MIRAGHYAILFFFLATAILKATTYYVATTGNDAANGLTLGTAWATIDREQPTRLSVAATIGATAVTVYQTDSLLTTGTLKIDSETVAYTNKSATVFYLSSALTAAHVVNSLVFDNAFSGGDGFDGGDLILVNAGVYTQQVELCDSGANNASRITYQATNGSVVVDGGGVRAYGFLKRGTSYVTVDGFDITGATSYGIYYYERTASYNIIRNCCIYNNGGGIGANYSYNAAGTPHTIQNCTIVGNTGAGVFVDVAFFSIVNSVLMGNRYGTYASYVSANGGCREMKNNCFYGNGINVFEQTYAPTTFNSAAEINAIPFANGCQSNIVQNPGFVDFYRWTFDRVYAGSGLIGGATNGSAIGCHQTLTTTPVSSSNYYVAPPAQGGNDANPGTLGSPWATITKSATRAIAGDTVHVAAGTYAEEAAITNSGAEGQPVVYQADGNAIVDGNGYAFRLQRVAGVTLDGFTTAAASTAGVACLEYSCGNSLQHITSYSNTLYGMYLDRSRGNLISQAVVFTNNSHGIYLYNSQAIIQDSHVYSNNASGLYSYFVYGSTVSNCDVFANKTYGVYLEQACFNTIARSDVHHNKAAGIYHYTDANVWPNLVESCRIYENTTYGVMAGIIYAYLNVVNCAIYSNKSDGGRTSTNAKGLNFQNCTIWGNLGSGVRQDAYLAGYRQKIVNCIIGSNALFGIAQNVASLNIDCLNNLFFTNTVGNYYDVNTHTTNNTASEINALANAANNVVADPSFRYPIPSDFRLNYSSPAVDAGTTNAGTLFLSLAYLPLDLYGNPRLHGATIDIGCVEVQSPVGAIFKFR